MRWKNFQPKSRQIKTDLCVNGRPARQGERKRDVGEVDVHRQDSDVEVQLHGALQAGVVGIVDEVVQLQAEVLRHVQVPLQEKACGQERKG